jgi:hypothetical protein
MRANRTFHRQLARWAVFAALACSLPAALAGPDKTVSKGRPSMNPDTRTSVLQALTLPDADAYFALDPAALAGLVKQVAAKVQAPGRAKGPLPELRAIGAPPQVDAAARATFPILIAEVRSNQREWEVASRQNRHVVVSNLSTGTVQVVAARDMGRRMPAQQPSKSGPAPDAFNAALSSINVIQRDVLSWLPREQLRGRLAVTVLDYDLPSNTVAVQVSAKGADPASAGPARLHVKKDPSVAAPTGNGVSLNPAPSGRVTASVALARSRLAAFHELAAASLVLVQLDRPDAVVVDLAVEIPANALEIRSAFSVDLNRFAAAGHYLAYLVVGDTVAGPVPVSISGK